MDIAQSHMKQVSVHIIQDFKLSKCFTFVIIVIMSNREYNIGKHVKNKHGYHHQNNENQIDNDVLLDQLPTFSTKMNPRHIQNFH